MTDPEIVNMLSERNQEGLSSAKEKYDNYVKAVCCNILDNDLDAEECVNDTFLILWNKIPPEKPDNLKLFIAKTARNVSLSKFRDKSRKKRISERVCEPIDDWEDSLFSDNDTELEFEKKELTSVINDSLKKLKKRDRIIFVKRYYFGMQIEKIAASEGFSKRTVLSSLSSSREKIAGILEKEGYVK